MIVLLTIAGNIGLPSEKANAAAGLMKFMRNIGMSVGTSAVTTLIARRSQYNQSVLAEYTRSGRFQAARGTAAPAKFRCVFLRLAARFCRLLPRRKLSKS